MIRFSNGDMFESGADALVNVPRDANPKIEVNHLYTIKKWHAKQERIQEILYWSHGASRYQAGSQKFHKNIKKKCRLFGNIG